MSLYSDLNEVLTPYAQRIKGLSAASEEIKADLDAQVADINESLDAVDAIKNVVIEETDYAYQYNTTRGRWSVANDIATITPDSSGYYYALDPIPITPGTTYKVNVQGNSAYPPLIISKYSNDTYTALEVKTVSSMGIVEYTITAPDEATHFLITKYGTSTLSVPSIKYNVTKTDKTLTEENVPADGKIVGELIEAQDLKSASALTRATDAVMNLPADLEQVTLQNKTHAYWKIANGVAVRTDATGNAYSYDPVSVSAGEMYDCDMYAGTSANSHPVIITDDNLNVLLQIDNPSTVKRIQFRIMIPNGGTKMLVTQHTNNGYLSVGKCTVKTATSKDYVDDKIALVSADGFFPQTGLTWDWWYSASAVDKYGTAYIGFISEDAQCGVMMRRADGTVYYKYLDVANNSDDHNPMGVCLDSDGYVYAFGTLGHSYANVIAIYKSTEPYTIRCAFDNLTVTLCEPTGKTYKCTYSQCFVYNDGTTEYITDFFRVVSSNEGTCYGALQSTDGGQTWTLHGVTAYGDPYIKIVDKGNGRLALCCTCNPIAGNRSVYLGEIDMVTGEIYNGSTEVGTWSTIANGTGIGATQEIYASCEVNGRTDFDAYFTATNRFRLLDAVYKNGDVNILWAQADEGFLDWTYYVFDGTDSTALGKSGVPFYLYSGYLPGGCFIDDYIVIARNISGVQDGKHAFDVYDANLSPTRIGIFESMAIRPINCGNGMIALSCGKYHDTSTTEATGTFTAWELSPTFRSIF